MLDSSWKFELRFGGAHCFHPEQRLQAFRSDEMIGDGGRVLLGVAGAFIEVPYANLSRLSFREVEVDGVPAVRLRRAADGTIIGEWIRTVGEPGTDAPVRPATDNSNASTGEPPGDSAVGLAGVLHLAGALLGKSQNTGLRLFGSILSNASQETNAASQRAPAPETGDVATVLAGNQSTARQLAPEPSTVAPSPSASAPLDAAVPEPATIPSVRLCERCTHFRPYVRVWERFQHEISENASDDVVSRSLDDLRGHEEKGKGEEARHLASLFRLDADRWTTRPSFFSYCAAYERDPAEPTFFIAQVRNADQRCQPVKRADGLRWSDARTDFYPKDPNPHSCATCAHRIKAPGPGEDAAEVREIVKSAIAAEGMAAAVGKSGGNASGILSSFPEAKRRNASAARAREMAQAFASRNMVSHAPIEPRYLDHCGLKSIPARRCWRVCAVENTNDCCPEWTPQK